jgi:hypothetical protein
VRGEEERRKGEGGAESGGAREPEREGRGHGSGWPMEGVEWPMGRAGPRGKEGEEGRAEGKERGNGLLASFP